jgi:hypothetical protein
MPAAANAPATADESALIQILEDAGVAHLAPALGSLDRCRADIERDRVGFLAQLRRLGVETVGGRQRLANALGKAARVPVDAPEPSLTVGQRLRLRLERQQAPEMGPAVAAASPAAKARHASGTQAIAAGDVALATLTNTGYLSYTLNLLHTLRAVGEPLAPTVYCADSALHAQLLAARAVPAAQLEPLHEEALGAFCSWKERGWARLMWCKCEAIRRSLASHAFVVFADGDIAFERRGAVAHCVDQLLASESDVLMQNDGLADAVGYDGLCAGFMAIRSTPATRAVFELDPARLDPLWDDQKYLNALFTSGRLRVGVLPLALFPNGQYFLRHTSALNRAMPGPFLVHFNWIIGKEKRKVMKAHGRWFVSDEDSRAQDAADHNGQTRAPAEDRRGGPCEAF